MRRLTIVSLLAAGALVFAAWGEAVAQRGQRGGGRRGGGQGITQEEMLENFGDIVEVIMTDEEKDQWKDLRSDEEKQAFIVEFWQRRDPTPGTPANEFQETYLGRVVTAMRSFRENEPGYRTDRGRVFIIYGNDALVQQETRQVSGASTGGTEIISGGGGDTGDPGGGGQRGAGQRQLIVWTINTDDNPYLEGKNEIHFSNIAGRNFSLQTRVELSQEAFLASKSFQGFVAARRANPNAGMAGGAGAAPGGQPVAPTPEFLAMQRLMQEGATQQDLALKQERLFFPAPENNTYTVFAFELGKDGLTFGAEGDSGPAQVKAFGMLLEQGESGEQPVRQMNIDFTAPASRGDETETGAYSFGLTLVPGSYRLAWGVMDAASERITTSSETFEVPNFAAGGVQVTSIIAAKSMTEAQDQIDINKVYEGIRVGTLAIDTDLDHVFGRGDTFELLYFVMGAQPDPSTQQYQLQVNHRILDEAGESIARLPEQTLPYIAIGQQIPLNAVSAIEPGNSYSVEINVKDLISGQEVTKLYEFTVAGGTAQ